MSISAKIIADSISPQGVRLTTMEVVIHRFVLSEFNTHRVFSRNSASSRAIPFHKQVDRVKRDIAVPVVWASEQKGMQGGDEVKNPLGAKAAWRSARDDAVLWASQLDALGVHKSICNRILEPFMWHTIIVSSTEWENFFTQRCSPLAQPEIRVAAEAMREALGAHQPEPTSYTGWHLPYIQDDEFNEFDVNTLRKLSVARCARVSYLTHDGRREPSADLTLYDRLVMARPMHASPLEHVATPVTVNSKIRGNFLGWKQWRQLVEDGNG